MSDGYLQCYLVELKLRAEEKVNRAAAREFEVNVSRRRRWWTKLVLLVHAKKQSLSSVRGCEKTGKKKPVNFRDLVHLPAGRLTPTSRLS